MNNALQIENALIESTMLGQEDHGIFTAYIHCKMAGSGCGFGGYALDSYSKEEKRRIGTAYGMDFLASVMRTVGVTRWEDLKGKHIRVEHNGWGGGITRIGHLIEDKWFDPKELAAKFAKEQS